MAAVVFPADFTKMRKAIVDELQLCSQRVVIVSEPETQGAPRPPKPYFSMKFMTPSIKQGDDSVSYVSGTVVNHGGQREMVVSFNCFGCTHEEAYNYMTRWQSWLELETAQARLRKAGIAVWKSDHLRDVSLLLETAFEGRSQMDVHFGFAANLTEDLGAIETIHVTGAATTDQGQVDNLATTINSPI